MLDSLKDKENLFSVIPYEYIKEHQLKVTGNDPIEILSQNDIT